MTIFPFIILKHAASREDKVLMNHERIHIRQQLELLIVPFYLIYLLAFFLRLIQYGEAEKAYLNISFEREAYANDHDPNYLQNRRWHSWVRYYKKS